MMRGFPGFPDGSLEFTSVPDSFFSDLLPLVDDLFELKVTLHCLWLIQQKQGAFRHITRAELAEDETLMRGLQDASYGAGEALQEGLERAVARGTLLQVTVQRGRTSEDRTSEDRTSEIWYFVNSERGRSAVSCIERGEWTPDGAESEERIHLQARRPNIFNLYEQNFGLLQPLLAEELMDAERTYPPEWIEEAFRLAVGQNVRRWAYVRGILERWAREGRGGHGRTDESKADRRRYLGGEYADLVEH
ncbi:MAG: DnaD domain protein [Anaerolineae bacterium]|nr:DnaD domain protein [Anaerolineae bacterium]